MATLPEYSNNHKLAKEMITLGKSEELMPRRVDIVPITAYRYNSLIDREGDDDLFSSDLSLEELKERLPVVKIPCIIFFSNNDQYVPTHIDCNKLWNNISRGLNATYYLLDANHSISNSKEAMETFVEKVATFLAGIQ